MTVQQMLRNMSQKELCTWIAYFKIESEEREAAKEDKPDNAPQMTVMDKPKKPTQDDKDAALFSQLLMLAGKDESFFSNQNEQ